MTAWVWRKSSRSTEGTYSQCVEVADLAGRIGVRDSKAAEGGHLPVSVAGFTGLVDRVKRGELDR